MKASILRMAYRTPPSSTRKKASLTGAKKMPYYEDLYGKRNSDEEFDRFSDECEEESSSEEEQPRKIQRHENPKDFFKAFATPKSSDRSAGLGSNRFIETKQTNKEPQSIFKKFSKRQISPSSSRSINTPSPSNQKSSKNFVSKESPSPLYFPPTPTTNKQTSKKLMPQKFGLFGTRKAHSFNNSQNILNRQSEDRTKGISAFEDTAQPAENTMTNTAGDAMDDLFRSGGFDNLDDGFPTLEDVSEVVVDEMNLPASASGTHPKSDINAEQDDISDLDIGETIEVKAQELDSKKAYTELVAVRQKRGQKIPTQPVKRKSLRQENLLQAKQAAEKKARRRASSLQYTDEEGSDLKTANHRKMTERAAALRSKVKRGTATPVAKRTADKLQKSDWVGIAGRNCNWRGKKMDMTGGIVVIPTDEEDRSEYVRY